MSPMELRCFYAVATYCSFCKAAEHLYIGQPALSRKIQKLEDELGTQLFDRDTQHVKLTNAGRCLFDRCGMLLRHFDLVTEMVADTGNGNEGELTIATEADFAKLLLPYLRRYIHEYPRVQVGIDNVHFRSLVDSVLLGTYDLAITYDYSISDDSHLAQKTIGHDHFIAVTSTDYPYDGPDPMPLDRLLEEPIIQPHHAAPPILRDGFIAGKRPKRLDIVPDTSTAWLRAQLGFGVVLMPKLTIRSSSPDIRRYEIDGIDTDFRVVAIYRDDNPRQTLANFLKTIDQR